MYIDKINKDKLMDFCVKIIAKEYKISGMSYCSKDIKKGLSIIDQTENSISFSTSKNLGLVNYNIFTFTDFEFSARYPLFSKDINTQYRQFMTAEFKDYFKNLNKYLQTSDKSL